LLRRGRYLSIKVGGHGDRALLPDRHGVMV